VGSGTRRRSPSPDSLKLAPFVSKHLVTRTARAVAACSPDNAGQRCAGCPHGTTQLALVLQGFSARRPLVARGDFEPFLGLPAGTFCGFVSAVSCPTLLCDNIASPGAPHRVLFGEPGTFLKRLGCTAQRRCQAFGGLSGARCCPLSKALALGRPAPVRGPLPAISRFLASPPLLKPGQFLALALRPLLVRALLALIGQTLTPVRDVFTEVGGSLPLIRDHFALVRDPVALVRDLLAHGRHPVPLVGNPLALDGHPLVRRRLAMLTTAPTLTTQPVTLALQLRINGRKLRRPKPDLRDEALDLGPRRLIGRFGRSDA